jgi:hypothetical protein
VEVDVKCKECHTDTNLTSSASCGSCLSKLCKNCLVTCPNKNFDHQGKLYCKSCFISCTLCLETRQCKDCIKKCFFKNCSNYFCNFCFEKNKHQVRPENTNCRFYKCESCQTDSNCILATVYCGKCDKRVCKNCFQKDHKAHIIR